MAKDSYVHIRADKELKEMLEALAKEDDRTVSNYIEVLVKREYKKRFAESEK